jgi:hypothetical protein
LGNSVLYRVQVGEAELLMQRLSRGDDPAAAWRAGDDVRISWGEQQALVLTDAEQIAGEDDRRLMEIAAP